jgi:hypothetical protein
MTASALAQLDPWANPWDDANPLVIASHPLTRAERAREGKAMRRGGLDRVQCPCCGGSGIIEQEPTQYRLEPYGAEQACPLNCDDNGQVARFLAEEYEYRQTHPRK